MLKHTYIQEGFIKKLVPEFAKKSYVKLFDLNRWFKETAIYFGLSIIDPCCDTPVPNSETLDANAAISLDKKISYIATTAARAYTLADGVDLQEKVIKMKTDGGDGVVTVAHLNGGTTLTFNDAGDFIKLQFIDNKWYVVSNAGVVLA